MNAVTTFSKRIGLPLGVAVACALSFGSVQATGVRAPALDASAGRVELARITSGAELRAEIARSLDKAVSEPTPENLRDLVEAQRFVMDRAELRAEIARRLDKAVSEPTPENLRDFVEAQRFAMDRASRFSAGCNDHQGVRLLFPSPRAGQEF